MGTVNFISQPDDLGISHRDGIWWHQAPIPPRLHRCTPWTKGYTSRAYIERCACGAVRLHGNGSWLERNSRKRQKK